MQNKAKVKIGKMALSIVVIKDYDKNNEQPTTNVIQNKANFEAAQMLVLSLSRGPRFGRTKSKPFFRLPWRPGLLY